MADMACDLTIVGAGPAGLYAAYYAGFRGMKTVVIDALPEAGGQITAMYPEKEIFDVAGFPSIKGRELVDNLLAQAEQFSPEYLLGEQATHLSTSVDGPAVVETGEGSRVESKAVLITGGIGSFRPRPLPIGEDYLDRGLVYFVPKLDVHAGHDVVIVGGGDSAFDWAYSLSPIAKSVTLVHRREEFRAHAGMVDTVRALPNVELVTSSELVELTGDDDVETAIVEHKVTGERRELPAQSVVAALGFIANIGAMGEWGMELEKRRIVVDSAMRTSLPRVFAAGDITTFTGKVPLISVGFGEAAIAVNHAAPVVDPAHGVFPGHSSGEAN